MDQKLLKVLYIILISLGLALVFNYLFFAKEVGISVLIFNFTLLGVVFFFGLYNGQRYGKTWWLALPILFFSLMIGVRANEFLIFLNICAAFGLLMLLAYGLNGMPAFLMKLWDYIFLIIFVPFRMLGRAIFTLSLVSQIHSKVKEWDQVLRVTKGVIMALPILIIFGILFSQADLAFSQFAKGIVNINISERTVQYAILLVFAFAAGLSYLSYIFFPKQDEHNKLSNQQPELKTKTGQTTEVLVFLGLIGALFLLFIGFQVTYLFGGEASIVNAGFTYAEYARRGFFELLAVSALTLLVLVAAEKYAGVESQKNKYFQVPSLILIAEVMVIIVSAFKRLLLYIDAYSLTEMRFYGGAFILLLSVLFILLAVKFFLAKQEQFFAFGALLSLIVFFVVIDIVNPDAFIATANLEQYARTGKIDVLHTGHLSPDASAQQIELYGKLGEQDKELLLEILRNHKERLQKYSEHWQAANLSRHQALQLYQEIAK